MKFLFCLSTSMFIGLAAGLSYNAWAAEYGAIIPDPTVTPGAVRTTDVGDICTRGTKRLRYMSRERADHILMEYGLPAGAHEGYEIDHLIPLGVGGADDDANLWPEPRRMIEPDWPAERKDELEMKLHNLICSGRLDVATAQAAFANDWTEAWKVYVGRD
jgi:hypothetical protein